MAAHRSVARPVALVCWLVSKTVAPFLHHVKALGVPNVRLQPNVLPLSAVKLQQQISVAATGFAALAFRLLFLLWLEALCMLEGKLERHQQPDPCSHRQRVICRRNTKVFNFTILLATSLNLQGSRLVLWLMARLLMCLGRAPNTWLLPVVFVTAFSMAFTSATLAFAKPPAEQRWEQERSEPRPTTTLYIKNSWEACNHFNVLTVYVILLPKIYYKLICITWNWMLNYMYCLATISTLSAQPLDTLCITQLWAPLLYINGDTRPFTTTWLKTKWLTTCVHRLKNDLLKMILKVLSFNLMIYSDFYIEVIELRKKTFLFCFTSYVLGHLSGIHPTIFLVSPNPVSTEVWLLLLSWWWRTSITTFGFRRSEKIWMLYCDMRPPLLYIVANT